MKAGSYFYWRATRYWCCLASASCRMSQIHAFTIRRHLLQSQASALVLGLDLWKLQIPAVLGQRSLLCTVAVA